MDKESIENLRKALGQSPNNVTLKLVLADALMQNNLIDEAAKEYSGILSLEPSHKKGKIGLAKTYYLKQDYSTCNVILEEFIQSDPNNPEALLLYAKALLKENSIADAVDIYQRLLEIAPSLQDKELEENLKLQNSSQPTDVFDMDEADTIFLEKPSIRFDDVGGLHQVKKEIEMKIIRPLKHPELYEAYGKKIGGGILLYGPPGCGKTYLAKATAGQVDARFINVGLNDILDMWVGNSEKNLHDIFEIARDNTPCVLFFDEIDALGASRSDMKQSAGRHLINQFLQELDGIENHNQGVLVLGATNAPWHLDPAFRRPGRFDRIVFVPPPDSEAREAIFKIKLEGKPIGDINYSNLAKITSDYSGADIEAIIDIAIEQKLEESFESGKPELIQTKDISRSCKKHKPTTKEWLSTARNYALYANDSGLYDEILTYLKIKK